MMINDVLEKKMKRFYYRTWNTIKYVLSLYPPPQKKNRLSYIHPPADKYEPVETESCTALPNGSTDLVMQTDAEIYWELSRVPSDEPGAD